MQEPRSREENEQRYQAYMDRLEIAAMSSPRLARARRTVERFSGSRLYESIDSDQESVRKLKQWSERRMYNWPIKLPWKWLNS